MRVSQMFGRTLREVPSDAELASHQLAVRAGLVRPLGAGIYSYLPLGWRAVQKICRILREEMDAIGGQELLMPVLHPASVWQATGRWEAVGSEMMRVKDRNEREYALAMTHEEVAADLTKHEVASHRQLPRLIYQIQTKLRDEPRPRGGLIRVREFIMKDAYSLDADEAGLDAVFRRMAGAYERIFSQCRVPAIAVDADVGMMGGSGSQEFSMPSPVGEDVLVRCDSCAYAANVERAIFDKWAGVGEQLLGDTALPERVATPGCKTIADVAAFLDVPKSLTMKAVFYTAQDGRFVFAVIRGDLEINEKKLSNAIGGLELRAAEEEEIRAVGAVPGYASPIGIERAVVVVDDALLPGVGYVAGANVEGYHLRHVQVGRDFRPDVTADIAAAGEGKRCARCGGMLQTTRAIELGHLFKLGQRYSRPAGVTYLDAAGRSRFVEMGSYGIGIGRLLAAILETHHDQAGIIWPPAVAPYDVYLISLARTGEVAQAAEQAMNRLEQAGIEVLYDDRDESAGVKFADADLIGLPVRLTVSSRSLAREGVELRPRSRLQDVRVAAMDEIVDGVRQYLV